MSKFFFPLLLLLSVFNAKGQDSIFADTNATKYHPASTNTPAPQPQHYSGEVLPAPIDYQFNDPSVRPPNDFKNPYDDVKIPNTTPQPVVQKESMSDELKDFASAPASRETQSANTNFDWNKTNADRFAHSPCITTLGFDPNADPKIQEQRYEDCESDLNQQTLKKGFIIGFIIVGLSVLIYFGIKSSKN